MNTVTTTLGKGEVLLERLLKNGVAIGHDCGGKLACLSCRVVVREGLEGLSLPSEDEVDILERAALDVPGARLACQVIGAGEEVVVQISRLKAPSGPTALPISLTPAVKQFLAAQLAKRPGCLGLRLSVEPAGCSGFGYRLLHADEIRDDDAVFESGDVCVVVDVESLPYVHGTTIDLAREGLGQRLHFDNPNARQTCGCGESFRT